MIVRNGIFGTVTDGLIKYLPELRSPLTYKEKQEAGIAKFAC